MVGSRKLGCLQPSLQLTHPTLCARFNLNGIRYSATTGLFETNQVFICCPVNAPGGGHEGSARSPGQAELAEKTIAAQDLLKRVDLRAPTGGIVHQLSVHTIGGVIAAGEVVMEVVPESDELQIEAKLPPHEIDHVHRKQQAYIRFSAFNQRTTPQLEGIVSYVSADLAQDRRSNSNAAYYTVRVTLPPGERRRLKDLQLVSGMPVEVFLQTGSRTMMSYLLKPITDQLLRTFN